MSSFTDPLEYVYIGKFMGEHQYQITKEFTYHIGSLENSIGKVTVPEGFVTDLTSIPWPLSLLLPVDGPYAQAAVLHDYMYVVIAQNTLMNKISDNDKYKVLSRIVADAIFYESLKVLKINPILSRLFYWAVRLFGNGSININTNA